MAQRTVVATNESASLWNYTLAPGKQRWLSLFDLRRSESGYCAGWTNEEVDVLRKALLKFGVGNWTAVIESGCLPGKTTVQINIQTQRMLGQQSTAEFAGLHLDVTTIGQKNSLRQGQDIKRKGGVIVNMGDKLQRDEIRRRIEENRIL